MENCSSCHGTRRQKGNLNLQAYDSLEALTNDADRWEIVVRKLRDGDMPPEEEEPRPTPKQIAELTGFVEREIAKADAARPPDPGRVTTRRLNRTEYNNTIRDLLGVDLRPADEFPNDDSGYGFDNIGDVLSTSPLLMEKQLAAAERIARTAIFGVGALKPSLVKLPMLNGRVQESKDIPATYDESGLTMANAAHATYRVPVDAEYVVRLVTSGRRPQGSMPMRFGLWLDGAMVGEQELDPSLGAGFEPGEQELSGRRVEFRLKLKAGEHWIAGTPLRLYEGLPEKFGGPAPSTLPPPPKPEFKPRPGMTPEQIEFAKKRFEARLTERMVINTPRVGGIEIIGPYGYDGRPSPESQARIFTCRHAGPHVAACRLPIVSRLARRAYRRPVTKDEVARLVALADRVERETGSFEEGLASAVQAILVSPDFLFRIERGEPRLATSRRGDADRHPPDAARARHAPVLFPVGQHARRGPRRRRRSRRAAPAGRARRRRSSGCWPIRGRRRWASTSPASGCRCARSSPRPRIARSSPTSTTTSARRCGARPSCSSPRSCARIAASSTSSTASSRS